MAAPVNTMLVGMESFFLGKEDVVAAIGKRLFRGLSPERIHAHESPSANVPGKFLKFAEYELGGADRLLSLKAKRKLIVVRVGFRFFGRLPEDAAAVFDVFHDALGTDRLRTTWNGLRVRGARWDEASAEEGRDEAIGMSFLAVDLVVPFTAA
jgi:hypothetical protein